MKRFELPDIKHPGYGTIDPLDNRYFDPQIAKYLSEQSRVVYQAYIESALAHTLAESGICGKNIAEEIESSASNIDINKVYEEEKTTRHDIKALVNVIKAGISEEAKPYVHFGATSYDIIANAQILQLRDATNEVILPRLKELLKVLAGLAEKYAQTPQVGRTHGQHGVPITFGFAIAQHVSRLGGSIKAIEDLAGGLSGKFSGATGSYNALSVFIDDPLKFEQAVLSKIGLKPSEASTQIAPPEYIIRLIDEMTIASGILANLGHDMRHLARTEIAEVREKFEAGQTGSSTMAHKMNPWNFENLVSMHKQILSQQLNANLNLSSEHQRDLTDSANSRFYVLVPAILANMAKRAESIMSKIEVNEKQMQKNLKLTGGAIAAEPLYLLLEKNGHTKAHEASKRVAHSALEKGVSLADEVRNDEELRKYWDTFTDKEKQIIENPERYYLGLSAEKTRLIVKNSQDALPH
ncbi:MAG TPA: lyase family protein [Candidatus Saccharimonadales bacterium]|nr:lyase family protein [Candidatus Saccharimonadales bacterium]